MEKIEVAFTSAAQAGYDIVVGAGAVARIATLTKKLGAKRAFVLGDSRLSHLTRKIERALKQAGWRTASLSVPAKESTKDLGKVLPIYSALIKHGMDRHSVIVAVGGGVIGDLAGFIAGTYLRGIRWVGVPTTLLAQVDSSIGGKTGVNHALGKNLIGVFHQPSLVVCDTSVLASLSERDRVSGFGEMIKYGLIFDRPFFDFMAENRDEILALSPRKIQKAVAVSAKWKARVVAKDELETLGLRQLLNFGHTLGHALEGATDYRRFRHGEAVLWGMRWAAALSVVRGHLKEVDREKIDVVLRNLPVPTLPPKLKLSTMMPYLKRDKKAKDGRIGFVLLDRIGHAIIDNRVTSDDLGKAFAMVES